MPNMRLILSIINHLKEEARRESSNPDTQESLEVAVQCLTTAYDLDPRDPRLNPPQCTFRTSLEEMFLNLCPQTEEDVDEMQASSSKETANKAEIMKNLGNDLMRNNQFTEALRHYTAAIDIDDSNAVYYCNRAAAYSKLNDFQNAIKDCEKAVTLDPKYAKAYGRMGLAYTSLDEKDLAIRAFRKASEIEPNNESYQSNLKIALEKKTPPGGPAGLAAGLNSVDWNSLFTNPAFRNMASSIMQNPDIMQALSSGMSSSLNNMTPDTSASSGESSNETRPNVGPVGNRSFDMLLEAGQYLAAQMQAANPDLVDQFRQATSRNVNPDNPENKDTTGK